MNYSEVLQQKTQTTVDFELLRP